jgi:two-component system response regulator VicR
MVSQVEAFREFSLEESLEVRVLVIEQDEDYANIIRTLLKRDSVTLDNAKNAQEATEKLRTGSYDLVFLSTLINQLGDNRTMLEEIRQSSVVPVIALIEASDEENGASLVLQGADYDLQKPFTPRRLRAAVTAVLRRSELGGAESSEPVLPELIESGGLCLSLGRLEVTINKKQVPLSAREFSLLQFLMNNPNRVFTREELATRAWGWAKGSDKRSKGGEMRAVDSTIKRLRSKIEQNSRQPRFIVTERNVGYRFVAHEDED